MIQIKTWSNSVRVAYDLTDEEHVPDYDPKKFFPAQPGQIFADRYRSVLKVGWGTTSTVWIAEDTKRSWLQRMLHTKYVALKIITSDAIEQQAAEHELNISRQLDRDRTHPGHPFIRNIIDSFQVTGTHGKHSCLVYEPMRETLWRFQHRFVNGRLPATVLKVYIKVLLLGLDYLHSLCQIIHTDLKAVNIMVGFEDLAVIKAYLADKTQSHNVAHAKDNHTIYEAISDFGKPKTWDLLPKIADFGLARPGNTGRVHREPIQAPIYTAPEVLMGVGWTYSTDTWNLGVLIWSLQDGAELFTHLATNENIYDGRAHVAEMIALLGKPPAKLLQKEKLWEGIGWDHAFLNPAGKLCVTPQEYYGGPFFDDKGDFMYEDLVPKRPTLDHSVSSMPGDGRLQYLDFMKRMLQWCPEDRESAKALSEHPWLRYKE